MTDVNLSVNKQDIINMLKESFEGIETEKLSAAVDAVFDEISTSLICGDRVEIRGFGSMVVRKRGKGVARNPKNGEAVEVDERGSLYFRASRDLIKDMNHNLADEV